VLLVTFVVINDNDHNNDDISLIIIMTMIKARSIQRVHTSAKAIGSLAVKVFSLEE
jgi:hypothetical protein